MSYVAFQYAEALFSLATEEKKVEDILASYTNFVEAQDDEIISFLNHPKISKKDKKEVLSKAIDNTLFEHFIYVLIDNSRIELINDCYDEFKKIYDSQNKVMKATVYSGKKLLKTELEQLKKNLSKKHNRNVELINVVDSSIIGGLKVEYDGYVLDQTINSYLQSLKNSLTK